MHRATPNLTLELQCLFYEELQREKVAFRHASKSSLSDEAYCGRPLDQHVLTVKLGFQDDPETLGTPHKGVLEQLPNEAGL